MVKEVFLVSGKNQPRVPHTKGRTYLCQVGRYAAGTPEFCARPGEMDVDGLLLCEGHALQAKLEGQIVCWNEMLFHVDLWSREAVRRNREDIVLLLDVHRGEVKSAMDRAYADLDRARDSIPRGSMTSPEALTRDFPPLPPVGVPRFLRGLLRR